MTPNKILMERELQRNLSKEGGNENDRQITNKKLGHLTRLTAGWGDTSYTRAHLSAKLQMCPGVQMESQSCVHGKNDDDDDKCQIATLLLSTSCLFGPGDRFNPLDLTSRPH